MNSGYNQCNLKHNYFSLENTGMFSNQQSNQKIFSKAPNLSMIIILKTLDTAEIK